MKIVPIYKNRIISLPYEIISEKLPSATHEQLKVILAVFCEPEFDLSTLSQKLDLTEKSILRALDFWEEAGVLVVDRENNADGRKTHAVKSKSHESVDHSNQEPAPTPTKTRLEQLTSLPHYSSDVVADMVTKYDAKDLIDSCQQILGKMLNVNDISNLITLVDQLSLSNEYILLLCSYAASISDKPSTHFVRKMAFDCYEREIKTYEELEEEINLIKERASYETFIRNLFGVGKRSFIKKEKEAIAAWRDKYGYGKEIIEKAYEVTVTNTNEPKINYANGVIEKWYTKGYKTLEEIESGESGASSGNKSFETNEFYEAALKRSYEQNDN